MKAVVPRTDTERSCDAKNDRTMAWAVRKGDLGPVHVWSLSRDQTGLACSCLCPGCGATLQAVNAGRPESDYLLAGVTRPYFRHHKERQVAQCRFSVARLAALHLLVTCNEIELPAPAAQSSAKGATGTRYLGSSCGEVVRARVLRASWLDQQRAVLELDNGRTIALVLVASTTIDAINGVDGVLGIEVNDPDVANLSPEEIMSRIRLEGSWLRWVRHWDQSAHEQQALQDAERKADSALDVWPQELPQPQGLSPLQRSESILHWALKEALASLATLWVPAKSGMVSMLDHEGSQRSKPWGVSGTQLVLHNVRLESPMGSVVPDIVCTAVDPKGVLSHPNFMIEVAVTHKVDQVKLRKIASAGYACVELNATQLSRGGRVSRGDLPVLLNDRRAIQWVHHPVFRNEETTARQQLEQQLARERDQAMEQEKRAQFLSDSPIEDLYAALHACLSVEWVRGEEATLAYKGVQLDAQSLISSIGSRQRGFSRVPALMDADGVLQLLTRLDTKPALPLAEGEVMSIANRLMCAQASQSQFITLVLAAINAYRPPLTTSEEENRKSIRSTVWKSISEGARNFARPQLYDDFVTSRFPRLAPFLSKEGTESYAVEQQRKINAARLREIQLEQERHAAMKAQLEAAEEMRRATQERYNLIRKVSAGGWQGVGGHPHDIEQAQHIVKHVRCSHVEKNKLIELAWQAREQGASVEQFYESLKLGSVQAIREAAHVLSEAYMKLLQ